MTNTNDIDKSIQSLIKALGYKEQDISEITVKSTGVVRVLTRSRELRSYRVTHLKKEESK